MVFKLENTSIVIDGRSILKGFIFTHIFIEVCKSIYRSEKKYSQKLKTELKKVKKEQKLSKKKQKVESN